MTLWEVLLLTAEVHLQPCLLSPASLTLAWLLGGGGGTQSTQTHLQLISGVSLSECVSAPRAVLESAPQPQCPSVSWPPLTHQPAPPPLCSLSDAILLARVCCSQSAASCSVCCSGCPTVVPCNGPEHFLLRMCEQEQGA
ncbi:unnamed protein product [Boreogadus saida]